MPNYCSNYLFIHSDNKSRLQEVIDSICYLPDKDTQLSKYMEETYPDVPTSDFMPTFYKLIPTDEPTEKWGTKWDMLYPNLNQESSNVLHLNFDTAWSPPQKRFEELCKLYEDVTMILESEEPGMGFSVTQGHLADGPYFYDEREYIDKCEECGKRDTSEYREEQECYLCDNCSQL